jgi:hypothetical protein
MHVTVDWDLYCDSDEEGEKEAPGGDDWDNYEGNPQITNNYYKERKMKINLILMMNKKKEMMKQILMI